MVARPEFGLSDQAQQKIHVCADLRARMLQGMVIFDLSCGKHTNQKISSGMSRTGKQELNTLAGLENRKHIN